jgi:hypothetical protein
VWCQDWHSANLSAKTAIFDAEHSQREAHERREALATSMVLLLKRSRLEYP